MCRPTPVRGERQRIRLVARRVGHDGGRLPARAGGEDFGDRHLFHLMLSVDMGVCIDVPRPWWRSGRAWSPSRRLAGSGSPVCGSSLMRSAALEFTMWHNKLLVCGVRMLTRGAIALMSSRPVRVPHRVARRGSEHRGAPSLSGCRAQRRPARAALGPTPPQQTPPRRARARQAADSTASHHVDARALDVDGVGRGAVPPHRRPRAASS